jgi:hypothetical protein
VEAAVCFVTQSPENINFPAERVTGFTVLAVSKPLDAVKQKRQQVKQTKSLVRVVLTVPVGNFVSTLCSKLYPWFFNSLLCSFFVFQRARMHAVMFSSLPLLISLSVIQLFLCGVSPFSLL